MANVDQQSIQKLIWRTCESVTAVLDYYRQRNPNRGLFDDPDSIKQLRLLHQALEELERVANKAENSVDGLDKDKKSQIFTTLDQCGLTVRVLRHRVERRTLNENDMSTTHDLEEMTGAVNLALESIFGDIYDTRQAGGQHVGKQHDHDDENDSDSDAGESTATEAYNRSATRSTTRLLDKVDHLQAENTDLRHEIAILKANDSAKLVHIHRLHEAIRSLNRLCRPLPEQPSWESLSADLPTMLKDITDAHKILESCRSESHSHDANDTPRRSRSKTVPQPAQASSTISNTTSSTMRSTPRPKSIIRPPSPTESTVSSVRSNTGHTRRKSNANASSKRNSGGSGGGTGLPIRFNH